MKRDRFQTAFALATVAAALIPGSTSVAADRYSSFRVAIYARAQEVKDMGDVEALRKTFSAMEAQVKVGKIYLETHRDQILVDDATLETAKKFFQERGVATSGGITFTISEPNRFETFCYSNPDHRRRVQEIVEHTAKHFDEIV